MLSTVLSHPIIYMTVQTAIGAVRSRRLLLKDHLTMEIAKNSRVLDIGCGPGYISKMLPPTVDYHGFDTNGKAVDYAQKQYGSPNRHFYPEELTSERLESLGNFDLVLLCGVIHHLNDDQTKGLIEMISSHLNPAGEVLGIDPCFIENQNPVRRFFAEKDQGEYVRHHQAYKDLISPNFKGKVEYTIREDMLYMPVTVLITKLKKAASVH